MEPNYDDVVDCAETVESYEDFVAFTKALERSYRLHPGEWDNRTLGSFLDGLVGFVSDMEGYYNNAGVSFSRSHSTWRYLAEALVAARVYE